MDIELIYLDIHFGISVAVLCSRSFSKRYTMKDGMQIPVAWAVAVFFAMLFGIPYVVGEIKKDGARDLSRCALYGAARSEFLRDPELILQNCFEGIGKE
jgi:hypothetical protein